MGEMINIETADGGGKFAAYCAHPAGDAKAAIIVLQEIFGVNAGIRRKCERWATLGYLALAPDLFWRLEPGLDLDPDLPENFHEALDYMAKFGADGGADRAIGDIEACIAVARERTGGGKVGAVGFCLGGRLAYMLACRTNIDAAVGYYGVMIDQLLHEAKNICKPLLLHIPTADHLVGAEAQAKLHTVLDSHPHATLCDYHGLDHGFATETGARRNQDGALLADGRTEAFFARTLG